MIITIVLILMTIYMFKISKPSYSNGVTLIFANIGTGKTTMLSKIAVEEMKKIKKGKSKYNHIVSNAQISGVTYIPDIRKELKTGAFKDTLILIDEGSIEYNNRKMNMTELEILYFKLIRHYNCGLTVLSQSYDDIDVTLRRLYTNIYILRKLPYFTLIMPIVKKVGIDEQTKQIIDEYRFKWFFSWRLFLRPVYFKYFNSWWIPDHVQIHDVSKYSKIPEYKKISFKDKLFKVMNEKELINVIQKVTSNPEQLQENVLQKNGKLKVYLIKLKGFAEQSINKYKLYKKSKIEDEQSKFNYE